MFCLKIQDISVAYVKKKKKNPKETKKTLIEQFCPLCNFAIEILFPVRKCHVAGDATSLQASWRLFRMIEVQKPPRGWCLIEIHRWCWCWSCHPLWASPRWPPTRSLLSWVGRFPLPVSSDLCRSQGFLGESQLCSDFGFALQRRPGRRGSRGCSSCSGWTLRGGGASRSHPCGTPAMSGCLELWAHATAIKPPALETFSPKLKQQLWGKTHTHTVSFQVNLLDKGKQQNSGKTEYIDVTYTSLAECTKETSLKTKTKLNKDE